MPNPDPSTNAMIVAIDAQTQTIADLIRAAGEKFRAAQESGDKLAQFDVDAATIPAGGISHKFPDESPMRSVVIENTSNVRVTIYTGNSTAGRVLTTVPAGFLKSWPIPDGTKTVTIAAVPGGTGLIRAVYSTATASPGAAAVQV